MSDLALRKVVNYLPGGSFLTYKVIERMIIPFDEAPCYMYHQIALVALLLLFLFAILVVSALKKRTSTSSKQFIYKFKYPNTDEALTLWISTHVSQFLFMALIIFNPDYTQCMIGKKFELYYRVFPIAILVSVCLIFIMFTAQPYTAVGTGKFPKHPRHGRPMSVRKLFSEREPTPGVVARIRSSFDTHVDWARSHEN